MKIKDVKKTGSKLAWQKTICYTSYIKTIFFKLMNNAVFLKIYGKCEKT